MLLVVGLDGATFDLIHPWIKAGYLPALKHLLETGTSGQLESTMPPVTAPAWASFMTGKNPGQHSVFDYFRPDRDKGRFDLINRNNIAGRSLWEYLSEAGLKVGVLNVPVTHPPRPVNGYLVPGLLSPDQGQTTYPAGFLKPYQGELGPYQLTPHLLYRPGDEAAYIASLLDTINTQVRYALRLSQDHPTDFLMVHFLASDIAQHALWKYQDPDHPDHAPELAEKYGPAIRNIYIRLDEAIGQLLAALPPQTTTIVMSDHGFGPLHHTINLNNFFIQTGLMALKRDLSVQARAWAFRRGITLQPAQRILRRLFKKTPTQPSKLIGFADVDWSRTLAYSLGHMGQVYLNLKGREPYGIVQPEDYETVRNQVIAVLKTLHHPTSKRPLVDEIIPREAVAGGPYLADGPDLHVVIDGYRAVAYPMFSADGNIVAGHRHIHGDSGNHRRQGIFIASGPPIQPGHTIEGASILDLAPTILHLMGVPVPDDMDGRTLSEALTPEFLSRRPVTYQASLSALPVGITYSNEEQAILEKQLRSLGYLD